MTATAQAAVPAIVVGGYLGAGKTTLVNHLLRHADGRRIAVLVNDFGEVSIDAALIEGADGDVLALAGGCICCSFGADLVGTLQQVLKREPAPQHLVIECSGVGLPAAVARSARLVAGLCVDGIVTVLDAETAQALADDRYVGDTVRQQVADADWLVLNKADLCVDPALSARRTWLTRHWPATPVVDAIRGAIPPALMFAPMPAARADEARPDDEATRWSAHPMRVAAAPPAADGCFTHERRLFAQPVDVAALLQALQAEPGVLRAKGWVRAIDGRRYLVQVVGRRVSAEPMAPAPPPRRPDQLIIIRRTSRGEGQPGA